MALGMDIGGDGDTGGLTSTIALGPIQGIVLINPDLTKEMKVQKEAQI